MSEQTLPEQIATRLRREILRGAMLPGSSMKERESAIRLGVSRTPMREAIRILSKEGLVELRPSRSPRIAQPSLKEVSDQAEVLIALEQLSAELACRNATDEDLERIGGIVKHMAENFDVTDPLDMFEIDMSFHSSIAKASHNHALADSHRSYLQRLWRARYLAAKQRRSRERVIREHTDILEGLKSRDPAAARAAIGKHLHHLAEDIRHAMQEEQNFEERQTNGEEK